MITPGRSRLFPTVSDCFRLFPTVSDCFRLFPTVSDCFRLFPTVSDCFRLFPTVSVSLEGQLDLWTTDSTKITTFNTFPDDPSARRLLEMMHFDFETQYTLKIPKSQDLVKFNKYVYIYIVYSIYKILYNINYNICDI